MEDTTAALLVDQLGGCSPDQANCALAQAAALHGGSWQHPKLAEQNWPAVQHVWGALASSLPKAIDPFADPMNH